MSTRKNTKLEIIGRSNAYRYIVGACGVFSRPNKSKDTNTARASITRIKLRDTRAMPVTFSQYDRVQLQGHQRVRAGNEPFGKDVSIAVECAVKREQCQNGSLKQIQQQIKEEK